MLALVFLIWYLGEVGILVILAPEPLLSRYQTAEEREKIKKEAGEYNARALTLAGLTFAAISLIYGTAQNPLVVADTLTVLVASLSFFLLSYSLTALVHHRKVYWVVQDKSLAFGYVSMFAGVAVLMYERFPTAFVAAAVGLGMVLVLHFMEFASDFRRWGQEEGVMGVPKA